MVEKKRKKNKKSGLYQCELVCFSEVEPVGFPIIVDFAGVGYYWRTSWLPAGVAEVGRRLEIGEAIWEVAKICGRDKHLNIVESPWGKVSYKVVGKLK